MPDMDKVMMALECLADGQLCACCDYKPYYDCAKRVARDAIDLLKEQDIDVKEASKNINNQDPIVALRAAIVCTNLHDEYSVGFRNGIRYAISLLTGKEPKYEDVT